MRAWRICRKSHALDSLAGRGGLFTSGRWHTKGRRVVYASESLALAALEVLVHADRPVLPADLVQVEIDVPDTLKISRVEIKALPRNWQSYPAPAALQRLGDAWLAAGSTAVLWVPSAVIPEESNLILNPEHREARKIRIVTTRGFTWDSRLHRARKPLARSFNPLEVSAIGSGVQ